MPVNAGGVRQVVLHNEAHPVPLGDAKARPRHLLIDGVGRHLHARQDVPVDQRGFEVEDLHPIHDFGLQGLIASGIGWGSVRDLAEVNRRHVLHGFHALIGGHDHAGRHHQVAHAGNCTDGCLRQTADIGAGCRVVLVMNAGRSGRSHVHAGHGVLGNHVRGEKDGQHTKSGFHV